ncbi:hypothetical protein QBC46DRAFT_414362 [Diplogelasinospora grovesii]|uniref:Uncharacterized protein n=1 Tax=Diplogelasinospora grovesii TaxID=303347 RepID=A0AAN6RXW8_9PEZI|nr:hypothetical protein QBC46DRAFT_414362 [Diplogelasinospora grovesii]
MALLASSGLGRGPESCFPDLKAPFWEEEAPFSPQRPFSPPSSPFPPKKVLERFMSTRERRKKKDIVHCGKCAERNHLSVKDLETGLRQVLFGLRSTVSSLQNAVSEPQSTISGPRSAVSSAQKLTLGQHDGKSTKHEGTSSVKEKSASENIFVHRGAPSGGGGKAPICTKYGKTQLQGGQGVRESPVAEVSVTKQPDLGVLPTLASKELASSLFYLFPLAGRESIDVPIQLIQGGDNMHGHSLHHSADVRSGAATTPGATDNSVLIMRQVGEKLFLSCREMPSTSCTRCREIGAERQRRRRRARVGALNHRQGCASQSPDRGTGRPDGAEPQEGAGRQAAGAVSLTFTAFVSRAPEPEPEPTAEDEDVEDEDVNMTDAPGPDSHQGNDHDTVDALVAFEALSYQGEDNSELDELLAGIDARTYQGEESPVESEPLGEGIVAGNASNPKDDRDQDYDSLNNLEVEDVQLQQLDKHDRQLEDLFHAPMDLDDEDKPGVHVIQDKAAQEQQGKKSPNEGKPAGEGGREGDASNAGNDLGASGGADRQGEQVQQHGTGKARKGRKRTRDDDGDDVDRSLFVRRFTRPRKNRRP